MNIMMDGKQNGFELMEPASPEALVPGPLVQSWHWLGLSIGICLLLVAVLWVYSKKRRKSGDANQARTAAYAEATAALKATSTQNAHATAVRCSLILRTYLSSAAGDPALFETHEEFISRHDALKSLTPAARQAAETGFSHLAALKYSLESPSSSPAEIITDAQQLLQTLHQGFAA